jgi:hypothetical protein
MTFGFALMAVGWILMESGWSNSSISDVLKGISKTTPTSYSPGAGDTGFISYLTGGASGAVSGAGEAVTPRSGGGGRAVPGAKLPAGLTTFDGKPCAKWVAQELEWARKHGWKGSLTSGYTRLIGLTTVCSETNGPCATPGKSNHQGKRFPKGAADVTNPQELDAVLSHKAGRRLKYTGKSIGDEPHFSSGLNGV